ncbi:pyruvate kinase [Neobacillus sp. GCM10023253]|uniref:pyruvate kinase n=1 Tax=Neobacillus sp. GCM10023253 TaxID=3252644 RepID=UPI00360A45AF
MVFNNSPDFIQQMLSIDYQVKQESENASKNFLVTDSLASRDNLIAYLSLRKKLTSEISEQLTNRGLAALDHSEPHVLYTLEKILKNLDAQVIPSTSLHAPTPEAARQNVRHRTYGLFGNTNPGLQSSIMVTLDVKSIHEPVLMESLLLNGMNVARINCAHHHPEVWLQIIGALRNAENKLRDEGNYQGRTCKIFMDLAGPKVRIGDLQSANIFVKKGDTLRLYLDPQQIGHPQTTDQPAGVPVTLVKAFRNVRAKDRIFIDDGKIMGIVHHVTKEYVEVEILSPAIAPYQVKQGKGINLPDSLLSLNVPALTEKDIQDLRFVTKHADIAGISFVHSPQDLRKLRVELNRKAAGDLAVVAKIETKDAIHQLSRIIIEGLNFNKFGIMIARGDLAVEVGPENLSFVQEEILTICSAAHVPVIWATGVLEKLTKKGIAARSEITDVSQAKRSDCVMLNKGLFINEALIMLAKLLTEESNFPRKDIAFGSHITQFGVL